MECLGHIPESRANHAAAVVDGVMYIFGGRNGAWNDLGDLAAFVIASRRWYKFQNMGPSPTPRAFSAMCVHNEKIFVVGGWGSGGNKGSAHFDVREDLVLLHTLDTSKIRFPRDRTGAII